MSFPRLTPEEIRRNREARDEARASGVLFDQLVERYLRNPSWKGGAIVPRSPKAEVDRG